MQDVSFTLWEGEVLGFAGLIGSGRTETLRAIFGADPAESGQVLQGRTEEPLRIRKPADAVRAGIGLIPEDRKQQGLLLSQSVRENTTFSNLDQFSNVFGWIDQGWEARGTLELAQRLDLRSASINIMNGMLGLTFSCDGSHYMPVAEFLEKNLGFWIGELAADRQKARSSS